MKYLLDYGEATAKKTQPKEQQIESHNEKLLSTWNKMKPKVQPHRFHYGRESTVRLHNYRIMISWRCNTSLCADGRQQTRDVFHIFG